ncbi:MAG: hypothetical protein HY036_10470 [Nitrospirae bacterium]|nr:hypothetical protein [Nitrospirota bacterium]
MKKIILLVGPSGAGKDTLLKEAKDYFNENPKIHFIRRYITRRPSEFEDNYFVDDTAFEVLRMNGYFISYWYAHHLKYGVPERELSQLNQEDIVVVSISREKVSDFEDRYGERVITLNITADREIIEKRLKNRNRENQAQIETRLQRMDAPVKARNLIHFNNNQKLAVSSKAFTTLLETLIV